MKMKLTFATAALVSTTAALLAAPSLWAKSDEPAHRGGTDILHFELQEKLQNDGVDTNATGTVTLEQNTQGHADHQQLQLFAKGLDTNATYFVCAATTASLTNLTVLDTNLVLNVTNLLVVDQLTTDAKGRATLTYRDFVQGNGHGTNHHGHWLSLPAALLPVSTVRALALADTNQQVVLSADLTAPNKLEYLLKRTLTNGGVDAKLWIKSMRHDADLRLFATGLAPQTDYCLVLDGNITQTNRTDARGRLAAGATLVQPVDILNLSTVALWDTSSNVVVSTQLY